MYIACVNLVFCRPLDRFQNTMSVNKSFSMHFCLIICLTNWSFCYSTWLSNLLNSPISSSSLLFYLFSVQLTLSNLLYPHISNECIPALSFFFIAQHSDAYAAMGNTSDLNNLIFALLLINFPFYSRVLKFKTTMKNSEKFFYCQTLLYF